MERIVRSVLFELREVAGDLEYVFVNPDTGTQYTEVKKSFASACLDCHKFVTSEQRQSLRFN